tara:strand:+ start:36836 stop:38956 length:2121 start_codon:yes stop_codon:yes gene_type:complete
MADRRDDASGEGFFLDLERYWLEARALRYWIGAVIVACLLAGLVITLLQTPIFKASARLEISQITANVTDVDPLEATSTISELQYLNTQYELLESRFMASRVVEAGNLTRNQEFLEAFELADGEDIAQREIEELLLNQISVQDITQSSLVDIVFSSPSARVSASIANLWAAEFISANYDKRFGANVEAREYLQSQIGELREVLSRSEKELVDYANENEILILENNGTGGDSGTASQTLIATDLAALNAALADAVTERISAEAAVASNDLVGDGQNAQVNSALAVAEAELSTLRERFGEGYAPLREKEAEVQSLRNALRSKATEALQSARLREQELRAQLEEAKSRFLGQQNQGIQYGILKREVETNRSLYDALLQRFKELEASGAGQNNIKLIDEAAVPERPASPSLLNNLLISLIAGLGLAFCLVYLRVVLSQTLRSSDDITARLNLPVLATIPKSSEEEIRENLAIRSSELSEAYISLRSSLAFLTPEGEPKTLMVTSTVPAEGKSTSSVALATSFAQFGRRTLLIDADLRNSRIMETLEDEGPVTGGLSALLTRPNASLTTEVRSSKRLGFDYVISGPPPPNPVDLLATQRLSEIIAEAHQAYDQVIIDAAPMLSLADAIETARAADGILYVIEYDKVKAKSIEATLNRLHRSGARVFGAVLTKLSQRAASYEYGYGYGYGHGYGYGREIGERSAAAESQPVQ